MDGSNSLARRTAGEAAGSAFLLCAIVGSGIMGERLSGGNPALALLANSLATGAILVALIATFADLTGAHFNPAVTVLLAWRGEFRWRETIPYILAQCAGAFLGVATAHAMFELPLFVASRHVRGGGAQILSEFVATFGLLLLIVVCARRRPAVVPVVVAGYITAAYWFTGSTSFANPAVTLGRAATDTFSGIRPGDVPGFLFGQSMGMLAAGALLHWLAPPLHLGSADTSSEVG